MSMKSILPVAVLAAVLSGCSPDMEDIGQAPALTPVGQGIGVVANEPSLEEVETLSEAGQGWIGGNADFFRDARASRRGDLLTVNIEINDKATLNSTSNRSRNSSADAGLGFNYDVMGIVEADVNGEGEIMSNTSSAGQGSTARSERVELSVAAMVTRVMPNGYLLIEGSQEVLVNYEQRTLHVTGVIRPVDISPNNSISYEKIAEARITYGGKGRVSEVQQPGWGQQIWDRVTPF
jgi:flagellar L-ring protein precursor FlgH